LSQGPSVLIPARRASTRLEDKLLLADTGTPLIVHTCRCAGEAFGRESVIVCTDDDAIRAAVEDDGFAARITDPAHRSGTDRIAEVAAGIDAAVVINVQGDEPEIDPGHIRTVGGLLDEHPWAAMGTLATPGDLRDQRDPAAVKVVVDRGARACCFSRAPLPWDRDAGRPAAQCLRHVGIYAYRREVLLGYAELPPSRWEATERLEQLRALDAGLAIACAVVDRAPVGIDTREDYQAFCSRWQSRGRKETDAE